LWSSKHAKAVISGIIPENSPKEPAWTFGVNRKKSFTMADVQLTAYNVKTKEKGVPIQDAVITKTAKGAYMVQGHDGKGNKLTTLVNEEKAMAAIKAGIAKQGW
jgi:hypothetical protein